MQPRWWIPFLLVLLTGCGSATRVVRLDTGRGAPIVITPRGNAAPVKIDADDFEEAVEALAHVARPSTQPQAAARRLFGVDPRSGSYLYEPHRRRITPLDPGEQLEGESPAEEVELTRAYLRWCERTARKGDCLHLLAESPTVTGDGKYALALALAQGVVLEEMLDAFKDMADPQALLTSVLWTWTTYLILLSVPEPFSKGIAAVMTVTLIGYVGLDTFKSLIVGFKQLVEAVDRANTFDELRTEGERYGKVMGRTAARAFAMLAMAAVGNTTAGLAAKVPTLPGVTQAAAQAGSQAGIRLAAVGQVGSVAVSAEAVTIALAPGAVAMAVNGGNGGGSAPTDKGGAWHHIASDKFSTSTHNGGPWTQRYQEVFDRAGMSLNDAANQVQIPGHQGPHPRQYHEEVYERLDEATSTCRSIERCREALTRVLEVLAKEIAQKGTRLNRLVTRSK
ncbi:hypothetical protein D7X74_17145 [Corallococcus sp. CA047B]|uniref:AHH domain-containing protein n=1 Tax=Corallococcus sp. CA047B TaxID=2316729 RepID=UPI000EA0F88F|nr:AHH domain-containing protein [Corallococcus sp. CA047B]RKH15862.1 hypothetical protein D7X74_17145 [Corallococcus sp. CA047B]